MYEWKGSLTVFNFFGRILHLLCLAWLLGSGVSVTINKANAVVTTYWSSLGVETVDDYILNDYSDANYICDFYLIRRSTGVTVDIVVIDENYIAELEKYAAHISIR